MSCSHETLATNVNTSSHLGGGEERKRELCSAKLFYYRLFITNYITILLLRETKESQGFTIQELLEILEH